ncbi:hypothetical protein HaLaN_19411 [Haematococcus lacustris]|uniref:Uncharacterized protein n=1 Tax=Haematococcus lacustris TaxID=44745 RepID=A0A6A0A059_HAELA|nr:hypothetical protein HaLaN_19411 [Haematococcus lacustris]
MAREHGRQHCIGRTAELVLAGEGRVNHAGGPGLSAGVMATPATGKRIEVAQAINPVAIMLVFVHST